MDSPGCLPPDFFCERMKPCVFQPLLIWIDPSSVTELVMMAALAGFRMERWEIYGQYEVPVVIVQVQSPVLVLFYLSMIYNK